MIKDNELLTVLKEWNLWEKNIDFGIKRPMYLEKMLPFVNRKEIVVIKGIRRAGKSTIMGQLMKELVKRGVDKKQILYLNLIDYALKKSLKVDLLEKAYRVFLEYSKNKKVTYFFIDEIQNINGWESYLRTKYDLKEKIKFVVTGSNASLLSKELATLLTGRNVTFEVSPLSLPEFYEFSKSRNIDEYLTFGGFPEVVLEMDLTRKKILLQQYFEDIVYKDIVARHKVRNVEVIFNLCKFLVGNSGGKLSLSKFAKNFGISDHTVASYISYMVDAFLLIKVPFFSYSLKKRHSVLALPKYYASDNGLIYVASLKFSENIGQKYENAVLLGISQENKNISYWSGKGEVDFVYSNKAINVTSVEKIPEREFEGLREFKKKFKGFNLTLISKQKSSKNGIELIQFEEFLMTK